MYCFFMNAQSMQKPREGRSGFRSHQPSRPRHNSGGRSRRPGGNRGGAPRRSPGFTSFRREEGGYEKNPNALRIIPIGGCEEVGRNMTVFEYGDDIIILDMGIQFPEEDMPGIDYIVPNTKYLQDKKKNIRAVVFSHGHLDHIGAAPILLEQLGNPVIVGRDLTLALIKHKQEDYQKGSAGKLKTIRIKGIDDVLTFGTFKIKFFQVEHSIMDAVGVVVETPAGSAIHPGDWTLDRDKNGKPTLDYTPLRNLTKPTVLMLESLGVVHEHRGKSYEEMYNNLQTIMSGAPGRIIIGTFSSQLERIKWVLDAAEKLGKKVALDGYSMKVNVEMAKKLGYIKVKPEVLIDVKKVDDYPENRVVVLCTGAQGEENAVLMRIVNRQHKSITLKRTDTVVFSSSIIPGNERSIQRLKDNMYRQCDNVIHGQLMDVHVSGHATRQDIRDVLDQVAPTYFMPVYANHYFLKEARKLAISHGFDSDKIFVPDNGSVLEVTPENAKMLAKKVPSDYVFVDGLGISDSQNIVLRDRQVLAEDGMLVVITTINSKSGALINNPDIISRGFVFLKDNRDLIEEIRNRVKKMVVESDPKNWADTDQIKNNIRDKIGQYVLQKTEKRPMILPVVIEV